MARSGRYGSSPVKRQRRTRAELDLVDDAIVTAVEADYPVTLRGVYYRVVSMGAVEKTEDGYRLIGRELLKLRREGCVPYHWITDGTRWITKPTTWSGVDEMLEDAASSYRKQLWHDQNISVELFTEKDAISGVILPVTEEWDVPLGVLRGYASESFCHSVAEGLKASPKDRTFIYQLGDHDPSGLDAWRAFRERVVGFLGTPTTGAMAEFAKGLGLTLKLGKILGVSAVDPELNHDDDAEIDDESEVAYAWVTEDDRYRLVTFARLAVTERQIEEWDLPTRPTKRSDSRARGFVGESVEVDAIAASRLRQLVEDAITSHVDAEAWERLEHIERLERETLQSFLDSFRRMDIGP
jgi:hypothetical protein